jgi:hypothetical protein
MGDFAFKLSSKGALADAYNRMVQRLHRSSQSLVESAVLEKRAEEELNRYRIQLDYKLLESAVQHNEAVQRITEEIERCRSEKAVLEEIVRKNIFASAASSIANVFTRFWAAQLWEVKLEARGALRAADSGKVHPEIIQKIADISAEVGKLRALLSIKDGVEEFSIQQFFEKCRWYILVFEKEGFSVNTNFTGDKGGTFFGYETFYQRTILFFIGYAAYSSFARNTEEPELAVNIAFLPEMLRISIMDSCKDLAEEGLQDISVDKSALLIRFYIDLLKSYGGSLNIKRLSVGLCYLFEFNRMGVGYEG